MKNMIVVLILAIDSLALIAQIGQRAAITISDEKQIETQMNRLASNVNPQELLDPLFPKEKITDQIKHFTKHYEIALIPKGPIQISGMTANISAHIIYNTSIGTSNEEKFEDDRNLAFVLRDGRWYFANYNFLNLTPMEYLFDIGLLLIAVIWLCGAWLKFNKLRSRRIGGQYIFGLISDYFRAINPLAWFEKGHKGGGSAGPQP
ncbi:MAG: hypothetical protein ABSF70_07070 [Terracidiphilus sp.]